MANYRPPDTYIIIESNSLTSFGSFVVDDLVIESRHPVINQYINPGHLVRLRGRDMIVTNKSVYRQNNYEDTSSFDLPSFYIKSGMAYCRLSLRAPRQSSLPPGQKTRFNGIDNQTPICDLDSEESLRYFEQRCKVETDIEASWLERVPQDGIIYTEVAGGKVGMSDDGKYLVFVDDMVKDIEPDRFPDNVEKVWVGGKKVFDRELSAKAKELSENRVAALVTKTRKTSSSGAVKPVKPSNSSNHPSPTGIARAKRRIVFDD